MVRAGKGNNGRRHPQGGRGGNQRGHGGRGNYNSNEGRGNVQLCMKVVRQDDRTLCYAFPSKNETKSYDAVITGTIVVCDQILNVLFYPGSYYYYVFFDFPSSLI